MSKLEWKNLSVLILAAISWVPAAHAGGRGETFEQREIVHQLPAEAELIVELIDADCVVESWPERRIELRVGHRYAEDRYRVEIGEASGVLRLRERLLQRGRGSPAVWRISVPSDTALVFSSVSGNLDSSGDYERLEAGSASGNIDIHSLDAVMSLDTASGTVRLKQCSGDVSVQTASGDVRIDGFRGRVRIRTASADVRMQDAEAEIEAVTASGEIDISGLIPAGEGSFRSISGEVRVGLADSPRYDLTLTSSAGDVELNFNGRIINGTLEFTAVQESGEIDSPFDFETEEVFAHAGSLYVRKVRRIDSPVPRLTLATTSGVARLIP